MVEQQPFLAGDLQLLPLFLVWRWRKLHFYYHQLQQRLTGLAKTAQSVNTVSETISRVYESVKDFFAAIGDFFVRLFGGGQQ